MQTEFEATFPNIVKADIRQKLKSIGAELKRPEFMQRRSVFMLPKGHEIENGWLRVRDEADKITMTLKVVKNGGTIDEQKEVEIVIDDYKQGAELLRMIGCEEKAYQETKRELWLLDGVEITIDEWPFLEPLVEIEGSSEDKVRDVAEKLGFDFTQAYFGSVDGLYSKKYNISTKRINEETPEILFDMPRNPFLD